MTVVSLDSSELIDSVPSGFLSRIRSIGSDPRGPILRVSGQHCLYPIHHKERGEACRSIRCRPQAPEYRGDLGRPLPCSGAEPGVDIFALLGEDMELKAL
jgi:hypothetical protein